MSTEVTKSSNGGAAHLAGSPAASYSPLREMLGYDPFRRFFSNLDPEVGVIRTERGFEVEIPVAGFKPEQVEITVKDEILTVSGKNDRRAFTRSLQLPEDVDSQNIDARVEHGMLSLQLERRPEAQPRRIEVKRSSG